MVGGPSAPGSADGPPSESPPGGGRGGRWWDGRLERFADDLGATAAGWEATDNGDLRLPADRADDPGITAFELEASLTGEGWAVGAPRVAEDDGAVVLPVAGPPGEFRGGREDRP